MSKANQEKHQNKENAKVSKIEALVSYFRLSKAELRKVSWPTYKETKTTSLVVMGFVVVMAVLLGLVDLALSSLIGFVLS